MYVVYHFNIIYLFIYFMFGVRVQHFESVVFSVDQFSVFLFDVQYAQHEGCSVAHSARQSQELMFVSIKALDSAIVIRWRARHLHA